MRSAFPGLSLQTMRDVTAAGTWIFSYFAYSITLHIPAYAVHRISGASVQAAGYGLWPTARL